MTTFKEIRGNLIKSTSTDPANPQDGQIWYNSTSQVLKGEVFLAAWSSGASMINNLSGGANGSNGGTQNASFIMGGGPPADETQGSTATEEYNGVSFSAGGTIPVTQNQTNGGNQGFGSLTAALVTGGAPGSGIIYNWARSYDGSTWSTENTLSNSRGTAAATGTLTAGVVFAGYGPPIPPGRLNATEEFDGTNWTSGGSLSTPRYDPSGGQGTQTSAACNGGEGESARESATENYDGTSWTAGTSLPGITRGGQAFGPSNSLYIYYGGSPAPGTESTDTLEYDGISFTSIATMGTGTTNSVPSSGGGTTAAVAMGGNPNPMQSNTQEFDYGPATRTFTTS